MRLFIAICFDDNMLDGLAEIQDDLRRCGVKGNYTRRENLHMTLIRRADCTKGKAFLPEFQESDAMRVNGISLMKSEQGKHGMVYTEIGYARVL